MVAAALDQVGNALVFNGVQYRALEVIQARRSCALVVVMKSLGVDSNLEGSTLTLAGASNMAGGANQRASLEVLADFLNVMLLKNSALRKVYFCDTQVKSKPAILPNLCFFLEQNHLERDPFDRHRFHAHL